MLYFIRKEIIGLKYDDLPKEIQTKAIENNRYINTECDWWDFIYEEWIEDLNIIGFENAEINFSGFYCQGDGASFTSDINFKKLPQHLINQKAKPKEIKLIKQASIFQQADLFEATIKRTSHQYSHEMTCDVRYESYGKWNDKIEKKYHDISIIVENIRYDLCIDIYKSLSKYYDEITSEQDIIETFRCNESHFDHNGQIIHGNHYHSRNTDDIMEKFYHYAA